MANLAVAQVLISGALLFGSTASVAAEAPAAGPFDAYEVTVIGA